MRRTWHVFWREYWGNLTRRSYLLFTFGFPAFLISLPLLGGLLLAVVVASSMPKPDPRPVGLVDEVGLLTEVERPTEWGQVAVRAFPDIDSAEAALAAGTIQAVYHLPPDYWQDGKVYLTYSEPPNLLIDMAFISWVQKRIRAGTPDDILTRLDRGTAVVRRDLSGQTVYDLEDVLSLGIVFFLVYFIQLGGSFTANYMFDSIASEAGDRTIEILITSVSPLQFLVGKVLGLLLVGLTQLAVWGGVALGLVAWVSHHFQFDLLPYVWGWEHLGILVSVLLGAYMMNQLLAAAMGMLEVNSGSGPLFFNTLNWVMGLGWLYAITFVPRNPHTVMAIGTSLFPLTAPIVLLIRLVVAEVPTWQVVVSQVLLWGTNLASLFWLRGLLRSNLVAYAARFRLGPWLKRRFFPSKVVQ